MTVAWRTVRLDPDALATLEEQRRFLQRSLADLEREHDAGDLDDADYATLKHDYESRSPRSATPIEDGQRRARREPADRRARAGTAAIVGGVTVFAMLCGFFVARSAGLRDPGNTITGDITQTAHEQQHGVPQRSTGRSVEGDQLLHVGAR